MSYIKKCSPAGSPDRFVLGSRSFDFKAAPAVMAVLNCTPDSFYDGGRYTSPPALKKRILRFRDEGADIIDLGAESTRPGARPVSSREEIRRLLPAYALCRKIAPEIPVSIDTSKSATAERLLAEGADMINDISGMTFDPRMPEVLSRYRPAVVLMHTSGRPAVMQKKTDYRDLIGEIASFLRQAVRKAESCGIDRILIDPGIGFGKTTEQNYEILRRLSVLKKKLPGRPLLIGLSRKSLIGNALHIPAEDRIAPTMALNLQALREGAGVIRVHDVTAGKQTVILYNHLRGAVEQTRMQP